MVVAIIVVITATILIRQARFDSSTLLRSLSYSIALTVRSAQVYGISVRANVTAQSNCSGFYSAGACYAPAYGVYFNNATSYLLFADNNGDGSYAAGSDTIVQTYQIGAGFRISKFCATPTTGAQQCWLNAGGGTLTWLSVYFKRPNPDALFVSSAGGTYNNAYIQVSAINDPTNTHSITVSPTGQIAVGVSGT